MPRAESSPSRAINTIYDAGPIEGARSCMCNRAAWMRRRQPRENLREWSCNRGFPVRVCVAGGGSSVSGSPTTGYLGGMGGGGGGHTPGSSSPGSEMSPQHNESPPAPSWPGEMKHHPHPHAPPHSHHHPHTPGHHPPPPPPPPHHAGYMPQYSWYQADPNPGLLT